MKKILLKTKDGDILFKSGGKFYSKEPKKVMMSLFKDVDNREKDPLASIIACEIIEEIMAAGGIYYTEQRLHIYTSSHPEEKHVLITILSRRADTLIKSLFVKWGYKGSPVEL